MTLSRLGTLRGAGLVRVRVQGNQRFYRADRDRLGPLAPLLEAMWTTSLDRLAEAIEGDAAAAGEGPAGVDAPDAPRPTP